VDRQRRVFEDRAEMLQMLREEQRVAVMLAGRLAPGPAPQQRPVQQEQGSTATRTQHREGATPGEYSDDLPLVYVLLLDRLAAVVVARSVVWTDGVTYQGAFADMLQNQGVPEATFHQRMRDCTGVLCGMSDIRVFTCPQYSQQLMDKVEEQAQSNAHHTDGRD
jgi:hypothetical protein